MLALRLNFEKEPNQVLLTGNSCVKVVTLNRPGKLNSLNHEMICQIKKNLELCENDSSVKLVILKGNGKAFCAGGDLVSIITSSLAGHWTYATGCYYKKALTLLHLIATYKKPMVFLGNGVIMGAGAGLAMNIGFRIVTEKAVFAMPEAILGLPPDAGASYFLSRLPGYFGEYLGLTGARLDGAEMAACGLATHFVPSQKLHSLENALEAITSPNVSTIATIIETFAEKANVKEESSLRRLETINKCFSKGTVEEIIQSLENELEIGAEKWITNALNSMRSSGPTCLKIFLKSAENSQSGERIITSNVQSTKSTESPAPTMEGQQHDSNNVEGSQTQKKRKVGEASTTNDTNDEGSGNRKAIRPRSWAWDHFTKDVSSKSKPRAKCNWCGITYAADSHKNGTSNLRNHLLSQCRKFPKESLDPTQQTLILQQLKKEDGKGTGSALAGVHFDADTCRQALARMIIVDELPFKFVDGEGFRYFMSVVQPKLSIPGRITIARDCWGIYTNEKHKLRSMFNKSNQSVSLTTDCWTSVQNLSYLCLTAHFIDQDWNLHKRILNFCPIKNHKGETIGRKIEKCLEGWLIGRVFTITVDNASSNDVAITYLKSRMEDWNSHPLKGEHMHVRCCAHILNLVVNDGLKDMDPSIAKIRNAVRYVCASPGRLHLFKTCIQEARIQDKCSLQLDVPTRWNSTYLMLESALKFQKAFKRLSEKCVDFVIMGGIPTNEDWDNARCFVKFLKIFYDITNKVSGSTVVTSSQYFNEHCLILTTLKNWIENPDNLLSTMAVKMKAKYDKYWGNAKNMNMLIFITVVLDPRHKFHFITWGLRKAYERDVADFLCEKIQETLYKMFDSYRLFADKGQPENPTQSSREMEVVELDAPEDSFALEFEQDMNLNENINKNEVDLYLMEKLEKTDKKISFDILNWWKVNSTKYPILGQIARDVLAMPVSTVASESAFSTGGRVLNCYRSSLTPKTVEALICTQNWCRSSAVSMDIEELVEDLEKMELELAPIPQLNEEASDIESD